jgi:CDP-diacylglycerol---serine O-phosphatidyltransferase
MLPIETSDIKTQSVPIEVLESSAPRIRRGIYLLPNLFTTASLFAGFYAIVAGMKGDFSIAAISVFIAMVADALDGRVARLTNTTSAFGAEYDSISDMVCFGVAPSLLMYTWTLHFLGKFGWLVAFFYTAATGLRLARFNTQLGTSNKRYFVGLPCTGAAGVMVGFIWIQDVYRIPGLLQSIIAGILTFLLSIFMISFIRYRSFKDSNFKDKVPFLIVLLVLGIFMAIALDPPKVLFGLFLLFSFSGPFVALFKYLKSKSLWKRNSNPT